MKANDNYTVHDVHTRASMDGISSGTGIDNDEVDEDDSKSAHVEVPPKLYVRLFKYLDNVLNLKGVISSDSFSLIRETTLKRQDSGSKSVLNFVLTDGLRKISFSLKHAGGRGSYLNAWWNPNKFLSGGQNIFPSTTTCNAGNTALGVEWTYLPQDLVEYPFKLLLNWFDEVLEGGNWPAKDLLATTLEEHGVFWQRLDFTVYSGVLSRPDYILGAIEVAAKSKNFTNLVGRASNKKSDEISMESLLGISFTDDGGKSQGYTYARLNKTVESRGKGKRPVAYSVCFYLKENEVRSVREKPNLLALKNNPGVVTNRLRQEFTFFASSILKLSSFRKILFGEEGKVPEGLNIRKSSALAVCFPDEDTFRLKINQMMVTSLRDIHLDWMITPKNPHRIADRVFKQTGSELLKSVLEAWTELHYAPLLPPRKLFESGVLGAEHTYRDVVEAYEYLAEHFVDVQTMNYYACEILYLNMIKSCLSREDYKTIVGIDTAMLAGDYTDVHMRKRKELMTTAVESFKGFRTEVKASVGHVPLQSQLIA